MDSTDLAFSRWGSAEVVNGVVGMLGVLTGAALVAWPLIDALTSQRLENEGRAVLIGIGLIVAGYTGWGLRDVRAFMRSRLLVDAASVRLDASGSTTYRWSQIDGFDVVGPYDCMGLISAGAVMRLRDGRRIPLVRLDHLGGDGRNSERAVARITERVATMNRMLAAATSASEEAGET